ARVSSMPGSVSIMTGCGGSLTGYRLGNANLLCNSRAQRLKLLCAPEPKDSLDDAAVAVEQHRVRQPAVVVDLLHPSAADQNRELNAARLPPPARASSVSASNVSSRPCCVTATAVSRGPSARVATIFPDAVSRTSRRSLVAAESLPPSAYSFPSGPSASAMFT